MQLLIDFFGVEIDNRARHFLIYGGWFAGGNSFREVIYSLDGLSASFKLLLGVDQFIEVGMESLNVHLDHFALLADHLN